MDAMLCPHGCGITFDRNAAHIRTHPIDARPAEEHLAWFFKCPACAGIVIEYVVRSGGSTGDGSVLPRGETHHLAWPRRSRIAAPEVPDPYSSDFAEAGSILDLSPQASAALARRILQAVLVDQLHASGRDLEKQIESVVAALPTHVGEQLHALRIVGNFAAHPIKDTQTGAVVPVEQGEAEWTLDTVEALFDHVFVAPEHAASRRAALNQKLQAAGKPQLDPQGKPIKPATP